MPDNLRGTVRFSAILEVRKIWVKTSNPREPKDIAADFDLTRASAAIDVFKWSKPPDAPARASIRLTLQGDRPLAITDFRFAASDLSGDGDGRAAP